MNKMLLTEGVSHRVFHFTTLSSLYSISDEEVPKIQLSKAERDEDVKIGTFKIRDKYGNEKVITYPNYLSLSRSPASYVGYVFMRFIKTGGEWSGALVRLELNSRLLNSDFKGMPVNYFTEKEKKDEYKLLKPININGLKLEPEDKIYVGLSGQVYVNHEPLSEKYNDDVLYALRNPEIAKRNMKGKTGISKDWANFRGVPGIKDKDGKSLHKKGMLRRLSMDLPIDFDQETRIESERNLLNEYEDRIFSFKDEIDFNRYVERIDLYLPRTILNAEGSARKKNYRIYAMLGQIYRKFGNKFFLYDSLVGFNSVNIRDSINLKDTENFENFKNVDIESKFFDNEEDFSREVKTDFTNNDLSTLGIYLSFIAYHPENTLQEFKENVKSICRQCGLNKWDTYDGVKNYTEEIVERSIVSLENFNDNAFFDGFTYHIRNYRYGTDTLRVRLLNIIDDIANSEIRYSADKYFNGETSTISTMAKNKWILGYSSKFARPNNINNNKKSLGEEIKFAEESILNRSAIRSNEKDDLAQQIAMEKKAPKAKKIKMKQNDSEPFKIAADKINKGIPPTKADKPQKMFVVSTKNGVFKAPAEDPEKLFSYIQNRFPKLSTSAIQQLINNPANYINV